MTDKETLWENNIWRDRKKKELRLKVRSVLVMGGVLLPPLLSVFSLPAGPLVATVCLQASGPGPWYLHWADRKPRWPTFLQQQRVWLILESEGCYMKGYWWGKWKQLKADALCPTYSFNSQNRNQTLTAFWQTYRIVAAPYASARTSEIPERDRCCLQPSSEAERAVCQRHTLWSLSPPRGRRQRACQYSSSRMLW